MKKRYWLFIGADYYPVGGLDDFYNSYDTVAEIKPLLEDKQFYDSRYSWYQIYDSVLDNTVRI